MFLPFNQRWTLGKSTLNEPVATADAVDPSVVDVDHVDLRVAAEPGIYTYTAAARICTESVNIDSTMSFVSGTLHFMPQIYKISYI